MTYLLDLILKAKGNEYLWFVVTFIEIDLRLLQGTVNFQNTTQFQINAWYQAQCLQFTTLFFVFQKNAWFSLTPGLMMFENN